MHETTELRRLLGALRQARAALELDTPHPSYLIAVRVEAELRSLACLAADDVVDLYLNVCELIVRRLHLPRRA